MNISIIKHKLFKETVWSFLSKGSAFVFFIPLQIFLARYLGTEKFGDWSYLFSLLTIISTISLYGVSASSKKYIAQYNKSKFLSSVIKSSFKLRLFSSLLMTVIFIAGYKFLSVLIGKEDFIPLFQVAIPFVFLFGIVRYLNDAFEGLHRLKYAFLITFLEHFSRFVFVVLFLLFMNKGLIFVIHSFNLSLAISSIIGLFLLYHVFYKKLPDQNKNYIREIAKYSTPLFLVNINAMLTTETDTIMLGMLSTTHEVGIYSVAKQIISKLPHIAFAISMGTMPVFAQLNKNNYLKMKNLFFKLLKINTFIFGFLGVFLLSTSWFFIPLIFGKEYEASIIPTMILIPYLLLFSYSKFVAAFLDYQGLAQKRVVNIAFSILLNILLNYLLIPKYGAVGSAIATSTSFIPYFVLNWLEVRRVWKKYT